MHLNEPHQSSIDKANAIERYQLTISDHSAVIDADWGTTSDPNKTIERKTKK